MSTHLALADLERYDPHAPHKKRERRFLCPLCGDGKPRDQAHRSLCVDTRTGAWVCHRCQAKGLLKDFWTDRPKLTRRQRAQAAVARAFALPPEPDKTEKHEAVADPSEVWAASVPLDGTPGASYIEGRGIPADVAHEAGVRFSRDFYGRSAVLFPMYDKSGQLVAINGRYVDGGTNPKTRIAGDASLGVFMTPGAFSATPVAIVEGPMDALSLWVCGVAAIALVGTSAPSWLPTALAFHPVIIGTDADGPGDDAAATLDPLLKSRGARTFRLRVRGAKDWSELLEKRGADFLRSHLTPFSENATDEQRIESARKMTSNGRDEMAQFIAALVSDPYVREELRAHLRGEVLTEQAPVVSVTYDYERAAATGDLSLWKYAASHPVLQQMASVFGGLEIVEVQRVEVQQVA